jgi:hypothetical protein
LQRLALVANPDRRAKGSVDRLAGILEERLPTLLAKTPGYEPVED